MRRISPSAVNRDATCRTSTGLRCTPLGAARWQHRHAADERTYQTPFTTLSLQKAARISANQFAALLRRRDTPQKRSRRRRIDRRTKTPLRLVNGVVVNRMHSRDQQRDRPPSLSRPPGGGRQRTAAPSTS